MSSSHFKVIVVGGGPVGLTAAHALHQAGIDFVLLEQRPHVVIDAGSNLVLSPMGLRTLAQLGLSNALDGVSSPLGRIDRMDHTGRDIGDSQIFTQMERKNGVAPRVISRHDLTRVLYDGLPSYVQQKLLSNKKLFDIRITASGVAVTCKDGSSYEGSIAIGADGAHSMMRSIMQELSHATESVYATVGEPFVTTYRALWVRFPKPAALRAGMTCETHGKKAATQFFTGEESGVIGVYERMDEPTTNRIRYSQADQDAFIERWGHLPVTPDKQLSLHDIYSSRLEAGLVNLEEGVIDRWSWKGRLVLAGDAAHKFTPSTGAGCNNGMIDIVALVNELHKACEKARSATAATGGSDYAIPSESDLESAFAAYQTLRHDTAVAECAGSSQATSTATWETAVHKFIDRRVMSSHTVQRFVIDRASKSHAPAFDFIPTERVTCERTSLIGSYARTGVAVH